MTTAWIALLVADRLPDRGPARIASERVTINGSGRRCSPSR